MKLLIIFSVVILILVNLVSSFVTRSRIVHQQAAYNREWRDLTMKSHTDADKSPNSFMNKLQSLKLIPASFAMATILQVGSITALPAPAVAAASTEASQLFAKSSEAIALTESSYQSMEREWSQGKKLIDDSFRNIAKSVNTLKSITKEIQAMETKLNKIVTLGDESISKLSKEVDDLTTSAAIKYQQAEESSEKMNKPAITANLFLKAGNEAKLLEETTSQLKVFQEMNTNTQQLKTKSLEILTAIQKLDDSAQEVIIDQNVGYQDMQEGIVFNLQSCRYNTNFCTAKGKDGIIRYKKGVVTITNAQDKYNKILKGFESELRSLEGVKSDLVKSVNRLTTRLADVNEWEKTNKLSLKLGKSLFVGYTNELNTAAQSLEKKVDDFNKIYQEQIINKKDKKNNEMAKFKSVSSQVKVVEASLEKAQSSGITAEKLLLQAKARGEKEAAAYMKSLKKNSVTATSTIAPSSSAKAMSGGKSLTSATTVSSSSSVALKK